MGKEKTALDILARLSGRAAVELEPGMKRIGDLGIDSPKALELLLELEDAMGVEIDDEDAARMESVGDILAYVETLG